MSNKVWSVSVVSTFSPVAPGQHYLSIDDIGTFGTKEEALGKANKFLKYADWEKIYESDQEIVYKFGKQEIHIESIYVPE
jgi:hypothetical protein